MIGYQRTVNKVPVNQESALNAIHTAPLDTQMGITPKHPLASCFLPLASFLLAPDIPRGDVHTTNEPDLSINHAQLSVVTIVHLTGKGREFHRHEAMYLNARIPHPFKERALHVPAAHIVVDHPHLHMLLGLVNQRVSNHVSQFVVVEDIRVDMDMMLRLGHIP